MGDGRDDDPRGGSGRSRPQPPGVVEELVTYLELGAAERLRPSHHPSGLEIRAVEEPEGRDAPRIRRLHDAVAAPHHWPSLGWSSAQWARALARPGQTHQVARVDGIDVGWARLEIDGPGSVRLGSFGLVPEFVGSGYGGAFLTAVVREARRLLAEAPPPPGVPARVWVATSSWDHPHALGNYLARGFRVTRRERRRPGRGLAGRASTAPVASGPGTRAT